MAHLHKARFLSCPKNSMRADEVESEVERRGTGRERLIQTRLIQSST